MEPVVGGGRKTLKLPLYAREDQSALGSTTFVDHYGQALLNCFPVIQKDPINPDEGEVIIQPRPGLDASFTTSDSALFTYFGAAFPEYNGCLAACSIKAPLTGMSAGTCIVAFYDLTGGVQYVRVFAYAYNTVPVHIGAINITSYGLANSDVKVHITEIDHAGAPAIAVVIHPADGYTSSSTSANSDLFYAVTTAGAFTAASLTAVADADFPTNTPAKGLIGPCVQLDNVHYVMTVDGMIYGSYPATTTPFNADITTWDVAGNIKAVANPDGGKGLGRYKHHLVAFGTNSIEFFNNEGISQPALPIRRTQQAMFNMGVLNSTSWVTFNDVMYLAIKNGTNTFGIYELSGYTLTEITNSVTRSFVTNRSAVCVNMQKIQMGGCLHIYTNILTSPVALIHTQGWDPDDRPNPSSYAEARLMYCVDSKAWWHMYGNVGSLWRSPGFWHGNGFNCESWVIAQAGERFTYVWRNLSDSGTVNNLSYYPGVLWEYAEYATQTNFDTYRDRNQTAANTFLTAKILVGVVTPCYNFGNSNRKSIHKIKLLTDMRPPTKNDTSAAEYQIGTASGWGDDESYMSIGMAKTPVTLLNGNPAATQPFLNQRQIVLHNKNTTNPELTTYNWGVTRDMQLLICIPSFMPFRLRNLEITLSEYSH